MATAPPTADVDLDELVADPYPTYARLRREQPVAYVPATGHWWLTRWDDCAQAGAQDEVFAPTTRLADTYQLPNVMSETGERHKSLRAGLDARFRPRAVGTYIEELARPTATACIRAIRERGRADAAGDIIEAISVRVVGDALGFIDVPLDTLVRWFSGYEASLTNYAHDPERDARARLAKEDVAAYAQRRLDELAAEPDGSALSELLHAGMPPGTQRGYDELIGTIEVVVLGGLQEPGHAVANALLGLLGDPAQAGVMAADPQRFAPAAVHEGLRWIAPFGITQKRVTREVEIAGVTVPAGAEVGLMAASANRDETRYEDPDRFDLHRTRMPHASFGHGMHFCVGSAISKELARITLEELFTGLPGLRLDPDTEPGVEGWATRGAKVLPVVWDS
jgi:cytochrome P450